MDKKREISQQIDKAFYWLDKIAVSGDAVEVMAMARRELRALQAMSLEEEKTEKTEE